MASIKHNNLIVIVIGCWVPSCCRELLDTGRFQVSGNHWEDLCSAVEVLRLIIIIINELFTLPLKERKPELHI